MAGLLSNLRLALFGPAMREPRRLSRVPVVRARYDAAQTNDDNTRHWACSDSLGPNAANSAAIRKTLRNRARYEYANNSYCKGIVRTLAFDLIGTGPRPQVLTGKRDLDAAVESAWQSWAKAVRLADILITASQAKTRDGEAFALLATRAGLANPVKLWLRLIEAEQVTTPDVNMTGMDVDGITLDAQGEPASYVVLRGHPGESSTQWAGLEYDTYPAARVLHIFRVDRPGQYRGVPEITPALPLFAQLRRYTLAVIAAAETAADFAAVLESEAPADGADPVEPMDVVELEKRMITTMPAGWKLGQVKTEQPATTYAQFKAEILNEIARCLSMPYNVAACNSASYNYASGRLDHQTYAKAIGTERESWARKALDPVWAAWYAEARLAVPEIVAFDPPPTLAVEWMWDGGEHVDPSKEASAQATRLASGTTTLPAEYAKQGQDWEAAMERGAKALGLTLEEYQRLIVLKTFGPATEPADDPDMDPEESDLDEDAE